MPLDARDHPRLVGRDQELDALVAQAHLAFSAGFRVGLVSGAGGLGKSRLVVEAARAVGSQVQVLTARAYRWGGTASLGLWIEALERYLRGLGPEDRREICGPFLSDLAGFLTPLRALTDVWEERPSKERMFDALVGLVDRIGQLAPVVAVLDDVHLADGSSWEALRVLSRRLPTAPIAVLATTRPADLPERADVSEMVLGLEDDGVLQRVPLQPLSRKDVAALAHDVLRSEPGDHSSFVTESLVTWLMERSLGHPLFLVSLLRALLREGSDLASPHLDRLPESLRERVALDLHGLTDEGHDLLEVLAVMDGRVEIGELQAASGAPLDVVADALHGLVRQRLVAEHGGEGDLRYEIIHPIIQETIYDGVGGARRCALHSSVAHALTERGRLGSAAAHFARAGIADDTAVEALFVAMEQAQARDMYQEALAILDALLQVLPAGDRRWLRLVDTLTWESEWVLSHLAEDDADTAIAAMERALDVVRASGDRRAEATVQLHLATFLSLGVARYDDAAAACRAAVSLFEAEGDRDGALVASNELAWIVGGAGDLATQVSIAVDVFDTAREAGREVAAIQAAGTAAYGFGLQADFELSSRFFDIAIRLAGDAGNSYRGAWARAQQGIFSSLEGDLRSAVDSIEEALRIDPGAAPDALAFEDMAHCLWLLGRLDQGLEALDRSELRRPIARSRRRSWGLALAARLLGEVGQHGRARSRLDRAASAYVGSETLAWSRWPPWTEGFLAWQAGDHATAVDCLTATAEGLDRMGAHAYRALVLTDLAEVAADLDDADRCAGAAAQLSRIAASSGGALPHLLAALARARANLLRGDDVVDEAAAATDGLERRQYALLAAAARVVHGRAAIARDRHVATDLLGQAVAGFEQCGAIWRRDRAFVELRRLGSRGRRVAAEVKGPAALTAREHEVAALAAIGYTAREIGGRLFIGTRTVETHLANIYAKLGVRSKRELVRRADELGLRPSADP
jgi:DNA-binding CsgD family transcriptional regulator